MLSRNGWLRRTHRGLPGPVRWMVNGALILEGLAAIWIVLALIGVADPVDLGELVFGGVLVGAVAGLMQWIRWVGIPRATGLRPTFVDWEAVARWLQSKRRRPPEPSRSSTTDPRQTDGSPGGWRLVNGVWRPSWAAVAPRRSRPNSPNPIGAIWKRISARLNGRRV
jgi:hypothetical protein